MVVAAILVWCASAASVGTMRELVGERVQVGSVVRATQTIYPGSVIVDGMVREMSSALEAEPNRLPKGKMDLLGKTARRTILLNEPITLGDVADKQIVTIGTHVSLVFSEDGVAITARGVALEGGALGSKVRFRYIDNGNASWGIVQADGSLRVGAP
jgi:flagella basal body P-ring formation protein FlgA